MKKDHSNMKKQYTRLSKAWYAEPNMRGWRPGEDEINIGLYDPDGDDTTGEFSITWRKLEYSKSPAPRLEIFDDAWEVAFTFFKDFLEKLMEFDDKCPSPEAIERTLKECGVEDATPVENPKEPRYYRVRSKDTGQVIGYYSSTGINDVLEEEPNVTFEECSWREMDNYL